MHIVKVQLRNFQKHETLDVLLGEGVNVIYGETGAGKSCVIRAIRWVLFNDPKGDVVRKEGSIETSVKVFLSDGIELERLKSEKANSYALVKMGLRKEFNAIGKTIPQEIVDAIGIYPMQVDKDQLILNIAKQISLPFLLNESGAFRMKVFNKLTGNNILDHVIQGLNKDVRSLNKTKRTIGAELENKEAQHNTALLEHKRLYPIYKMSNDILTKLVETKRASDEVHGLVDRQKTAITNLEEATEASKAIKVIPDKVVAELSDNVKKHSDAKLYIDKIKELALYIEHIGQEKFKIIEQSKLEEIRVLIDIYESGKDITLRLGEVKSQIKDGMDMAGKCLSALAKLQDEYKAEFKKAESCPVCKQVISKEYAEAITI